MNKTEQMKQTHEALGGSDGTQRCSATAEGRVGPWEGHRRWPSHASICAFGFFDLDGQRSWVIRKGLQEAGFDVSLCRTDTRGFLPKLRDLLKQWKTIGAIDALYVVFPGYFPMPLAWWLARRRGIPVIFDVFISLYDTIVGDRALITRWHPKAWILLLVDWLSCALADVILIDTEEHRDFFVRHYHIAREKFLVIPVGSRTDLFTARNTGRHDFPFLVRFHGSFIPLHGIETILRAAGELQGEDIVFELAGKGQTFASMQKLAEQWNLTNVRFVGMKKLEEIPDFIAGADVCLGIFGTGSKAQRVIPTKAYEIMAMGKPLITARSPATERVFRNRQDALLVHSGNPHDLAEKIRELKTHPDLAASIAQNGRTLFLEKFQPLMIVQPIVEWLRKR